MKTCLLFSRSHIRFALALEHVRRICAFRDIRELPSPAPGVLGVVADESHIVSVIESPLPAPDPSIAAPRILLMNNGSAPFGIQVESLEGPRPLRIEIFDPESAAWTALCASTPTLREVPLDTVVGMAHIPLNQQNPAQQETVLLVHPSPLYRARLPQEVP